MSNTRRSRGSLLFMPSPEAPKIFPSASKSDNEKKGQVCELLTTAEFLICRRNRDLANLGKAA